MSHDVIYKNRIPFAVTEDGDADDPAAIESYVSSHLAVQGVGGGTLLCRGRRPPLGAQLMV